MAICSLKQNDIQEFCLGCNKHVIIVALCFRSKILEIKSVK